MVTYESVIDRVSAVRPKVTLPCPGIASYTWAAKTYAPPPSSTRSYDDSLVTSSWKSQPDMATSRSWPSVLRGDSIRFTPYAVGKRSTQYFLVHRPRQESYWADYYRTKNGACCNPGFTWKDTKSWTEVFDVSSLTSWNQVFDQTSPLLSPSAIKKAVAATQLEAYNSNVKGFDLLTEVTESKQTFNFLRSQLAQMTKLLERQKRSNVQVWKSHRHTLPRTMLRHSDKAVRKFASRWLQLRYALLPIIYSFRTIRKEYHESAFIFNETRSTRVLNLDHDPEVSDLPSTCLIKTSSGKVTVRSTSKSRYRKGGLHRLMSRTSFNPFVTLWELIPYSFVADWAFNLGDVIQHHTQLDFAVERKNCSSTRKDYTITTHFKDTSSDVSVRVWPTGKVCRPAYTDEIRLDRDIFDPVASVKEDSYGRWLFEVPGASAAYDPHLDWRRFMDAFALAYRPISKRLKALR